VGLGPPDSNHLIIFINMNSHRFSALAVGAVSLAFVYGCAIFDVDTGTPQENLDANRAVWNASGIADYSMRFQRLCSYCDPDWLVSVKVTVTGGTVVEAVDWDTGNPAPFEPWAYYTVSDLFDLIQNAIVKNAVELRVRYDAELGFPADVNIDVSRIQLSDDFRSEVRSLTAIQ